MNTFERFLIHAMRYLNAKGLFTCVISGPLEGAFQRKIPAASLLPTITHIIQDPGSSSSSVVLFFLWLSHRCGLLVLLGLTFLRFPFMIGILKHFPTCSHSVTSLGGKGYHSRLFSILKTLNFFSISTLLCAIELKKSSSENGKRDAASFSLRQSSRHQQYSGPVNEMGRTRSR